MKNLKKVAAVLAAAMAMNAVAVTGAFSASAADDADIIANVSLKGQMGGYQYWGEGDERNTDDITSTPAKITNEDGQYTATWNITGDGTGTIEFLMLEFDSVDDNFITADTYPKMSVKVDSVKVDGETVDYKGAETSINTAYYADDKGSTRVYPTDTWGVSKAGKINDLPKDTAVMQSIEVTFSVANLETALPYGDVDQDGNVNTNDLLDLMIEVAQKGAGMEATYDDYKFKLADLDGNGKLDTSDIFYLMLHIAQAGAGVSVDPYPVEAA